MLLGALSGGISFSFYGQAPFYLMTSLGMGPRAYEASLAVVAFGALIGGLTARQWGQTRTPQKVIAVGIQLMTIASLVSVGCVFLYQNGGCSAMGLAISIIVCQTVMEWSKVCIGSTAYAIALQEYQVHIGLASSVLGFGSYLVLAGVAWGLSFIPSHSLWGMPCYFLFLVAIIRGVYRLG
jgi:hypothetical protein